jgi:hypothetical protein
MPQTRTGGRLDTCGLLDMGRVPQDIRALRATKQQTYSPITALSMVCRAQAPRPYPQSVVSDQCTGTYAMRPDTSGGRRYHPSYPPGTSAGRGFTRSRTSQNLISVARPYTASLHSDPPMATSAGITAVSATKMLSSPTPTGELRHQNISRYAGRHSVALEASLLGPHTRQQTERIR